MNHPSTADTDQWRDRLIALGFTDDGEQLRGLVVWQHPSHGSVAARIRIRTDASFPFAPPAVEVTDPGTPLEFTFHINHDGTLCLWVNDWAVDEAPWRDPATLLQRVAGWLERTAAGWPDDDICDLERYLDQDDTTLVLYEATALPVRGAVRSATDSAASTITVTAEQRRIGDLRDPKRRRRKNSNLAWVDDIGVVHRPLKSWDDVASALGQDAREVGRLIVFGAVTLLLLRYTRGRAQSALALRVRQTGSTITVAACESADTSAATRALRAGPDAETLRDVKIAVIGCGAIGSFAADFLFRAGVRQLTLRDSERLRPGNVVRHLAGSEHVGRRKTDALRECLAGVDPDVAGVTADSRSVLTLDDAIQLVRDHHVVLDATGNARASSLLATAVELVGAGIGHSVVSACVQRDGDVLRVDRLPLRGGEQYLPALPLLDDADHPREHGCGNPVSPTSPGAVIAAAELAHRVVIDEATRTCSLPATVADVRRAQPEQPYDIVGPVNSATT